MKLSRPSRFIAALIALFGMLFMQLAVASYACPGINMGADSGMASMSAGIDDQRMSSCASMDTIQPNLCHAYEHADKQSLDKPELPEVQPFIAVGLALPVDTLVLATLPDATPTESARLTHATAPPISIRNCCFRI